MYITTKTRYSCGHEEFATQKCQGSNPTTDSEPKSVNELVRPRLQREEKIHKAVCLLCKRILPRWEGRHSKIDNNRPGHVVVLALTDGVAQEGRPSSDGNNGK